VRPHPPTPSPIALPPTGRGGAAALRRFLLWAAVTALAAGQLLLAGLVLVSVWRARLAVPAPTFLLRDRDGRFLGEVGATRDGGLGYWPVAELPPRVLAATLALEDRRFRSHPGVDPLAVARALGQNLRSRGRVSGASTLAMQVARMQHPGGRGYLRKASEAVTGVFLTQLYGRAAVLRQYLRIVPYGNRIHGIAYAARRYFDKPVADLSWAEIAFLAALPQAPGRMNPFLPAGRRQAVARGQRVLRALAAQRVIGAADYDLASRQLAVLRIPWRERRSEEALHALLRLEHLLGGVDAGAVRAGRVQPVVQTTLDLDLQKEVAWRTWRSLRDWESRGAGNAAVVVVDLRSSEVVAWVGSARYFDDRQAGAIDYTRVRRSAGSALKPFLYALALERGAIGPATILDDVARGPGGVADADDLFLGPLLPRVALANSRNVPAVELLGRVGLDEGYAAFRELGLADGTVSARRYGLGLAIGGLPVTLEEVVRAYLALASDGRTADLRWYRGQPSGPRRRVFSEETVRQVTLFLADPLARLPSFPRMGSTEYRFPVAVKTGTSTNFHDAWAVAWSPRYLVGAWVGHPAFRPMNHLSGYLSAAHLVQEVLQRLHPDQLDGLADLSFPPPRGYRPARVCALSGARATAACEQVFLEWFRPGEEPVDECNVHQQRAVDRRNGVLATAATPRPEIEVRTFVALPPRYAAWQATAGLPRPPDEASDPALAPAPVLAAVLRSRGPARLRITSPENNVRLLRDPETPADRSTLTLSAVVDPPTRQVVWYVDGQPFATIDYPYTTRWRLAPGEHTFQIRLPFMQRASAAVRVVVQ
jgi:penicillin-binding protein 1C